MHDIDCMRTSQDLQNLCTQTERTGRQKQYFSAAIGAKPKREGTSIGYRGPRAWNQHDNDTNEVRFNAKHKNCATLTI